MMGPSSNAIRLKLQGRSVGLYKQPILASAVMVDYPAHFVVLRKRFSIFSPMVLAPDEMLFPGRTYSLVPFSIFSRHADDLQNLIQLQTPFFEANGYNPSDSWRKYSTLKLLLDRTDDVSLSSSEDEAADAPEEKKDPKQEWEWPDPYKHVYDGCRLCGPETYINDQPRDCYQSDRLSGNMDVKSAGQLSVPKTRGESAGEVRVGYDDSGGNAADDVDDGGQKTTVQERRKCKGLSLIVDCNYRLEDEATGMALPMSPISSFSGSPFTLASSASPPSMSPGPSPRPSRRHAIRQKYQETVLSVWRYMEDLRIWLSPIRSCKENWQPQLAAIPEDREWPSPSSRRKQLNQKCSAVSPKNPRLKESLRCP